MKVVMKIFICSFLFFCLNILILAGCHSLPVRNIAQTQIDDSTNLEKPTGRNIEFLATADINKKSGFKFNREMSINEVCKVVYGTNNYNQEGNTPIDFTVYPPKGLSHLIPEEDPWAFSPGIKMDKTSSEPPKPLSSKKANFTHRYNSMTVEWGGIQPGFYVRKTMEVNVDGHYMTGISYEIRKGKDGQTFDEMEYQGRVSCTPAGY